MTATAPKQSRTAKAAEIARDPAGFSRGWLCHDPWPLQEAILRSVATKRWTSVKACHASGKSFAGADAVLWWIARYPDGIAVTTAPTEDQVKNLIWREIRKATEKARIAYPKPDVMKIELGPNRYAIGRATNQGINFQGFHGRVLVVIDEAPGVELGVYEAIEGIQAGGDVHVLELGNPTISSGGFYESFHSKRANRSCFTISAFDTPNFDGIKFTYEDQNGVTVTQGRGERDLMELSEAELDQNVRPYLTTRRWVKERYLEWGVTHARWAARVLGNFPHQSEKSLLSLEWLERAGLIEGVMSDVLVCGLDVAGPGEDETVLTVRCGGRILEIEAWADADPRGKVLSRLIQWERKIPIKAVNVDSNGIGYNFGKHLKDFGIPVVEVNVGRAAKDSGQFLNLKAELYWSLRDKFKDGEIGGLKNEKAVGQLAGILYDENSAGKTFIESKKDAIKRGVKSPDLAESIMLAFAEMSPAPAFAGGSYGW